MQTTTTPQGEAMMALCLEILNAGFKLRAMGKKSGTVTPWGGGSWGLLRTLVTEGPKTVPDIARSRPVARQHIQKLVNELRDMGLIRFVDNPAHKRSRLVDITGKGRTVYDSMTADVAAMAEDLARDLPAGDLDRARHTVSVVGAKLAAKL